MARVRRDRGYFDPLLLEETRRLLAASRAIAPELHHHDVIIVSDVS